MTMTGDYNSWERVQDLSEAIRNVFRGRAFFYRYRIPAFTAPQTYYFGFTTHPTKQTAVYIRAFDASEGPVALMLYPTGNWSGGDTPVSPFNLRIGSPSAVMSVVSNATGFTPGAAPPSEIDYAFSSGNNVSVAGSAGLPTIFEPNQRFVISVNAPGSGAIRGVVLSLAFAEIIIPPNI